MAKSSHQRTTDRVVIVLGVLALLGGLVETLQNHGDEDSPPGHLLQRGTPAPPIDVTSHAQPERHLTSADLHGKVVVLDFWGTWCGPCREEAPRVRDLSRRYASTGDVVVLAIDEAFDGSGPEGRAVIDGFLHDEALEDFPVFSGAESMIATYRIEAFPTLYVIDRQGLVRFASTGTVSARQLVDTVENARQ